MEPVIARDDLAYERISIQTWLASNYTSPVTNPPLATEHLHHAIACKYQKPHGLKNPNWAADSENGEWFDEKVKCFSRLSIDSFLT